MNVMILQIKGKKAVALSSGGDVVTLKALAGMKVGCTFQYESPMARPSRRVLPALAASLVVLAASAALWMSLSVSTYVDVNINPGIRMALNAFGLVVRTEAINSDGQTLLSGMKTGLFGSAEDELAEIIGRAVDGGYLKESGGVLITISDDSRARAEAKEKALFAASLKCIQEKKINAVVLTQKISMKALDTLRRQEGPESGASRQRYLAMAWHEDTNPLYIDRAEAMGGGRIKVVFSRSVAPAGDERIELCDQQGNPYGVQVVSRAGDEWILQCGELAGGQGYSLTISNLEDSPAVNAFVMIPETLAAIEGESGGIEKGDDEEDSDTGKQPVVEQTAPAASGTCDEAQEDGDRQDNDKKAKSSVSPEKSNRPEPTNKPEEGKDKSDKDEGNRDKAHQSSTHWHKHIEQEDDVEKVKK